MSLCDPMDCSLPGSSVYGILQTRILEWVALLQGIFLTQGLNSCLLCLLHWQVGSLPLAPPLKGQRSLNCCMGEWEDVEKGTVLTSTPTCLLSQWSVRALPPRIDRCPVVDWGPSPWNLTRLWQKTLSPLFLPYLSKWRPFQSRKTGFIACFLQIGESSYKCILTSYEATIYLTTDWLSSKWGMPSYGLCANTILQVLKHQ